MYNETDAARALGVDRQKLVAWRRAGKLDNIDIFRIDPASPPMSGGRGPRRHYDADIIDKLASGALTWAMLDESADG